MNENLQDLNKILTGFSDLDYYLKGLEKGDLITIASRPKNGRTTLAFNIGAFVAGAGTPVAIFNLKSKALKDNKELKNMYIFNDFDLDRIKEKSIKLLLNYNLGLVIIDDVELIESNNNEVWLGLYKMAKELDIPILVTTKVNIPKRKDDKLYLADLNYDILHYARQILFLYNEENRLIVNVARNTNGNIGVIKLESIEVFDIGRSTLQALAKFELNLDNASNCGESNEYSNGNGSLMRILPIAYYIYYKNITDNQKIYNIVKQVSSITHAHEISILGCYIYVRYVIELLKGKDKVEAYNNIKKLDYSMFSSNSIGEYRRILKGNIQNVKEENISSSGYIVSTLEATMWLFLNSDNYNTTILKAVNLGDDTDTIGACTGGLLGIYYGIENIKESWKQTLKKYDYITSLCKEFDKYLSEKDSTM